MNLDTFIALAGGALLYDGVCRLLNLRAGGRLLLAGLCCFAYLVLQR